MAPPRSYAHIAAAVLTAALVAAAPAVAWNASQIEALLASVTKVQADMAGGEAQARKAEGVVGGVLERHGYTLPADRDARDARVGELAQDPAVASNVRSNLTAADRRDLEEARGDLTSAERIVHDVLAEIETILPQLVAAGIWAASEVLSGKNMNELTDGLSDATEKLDKTRTTGEKVLDIVGKLLPFITLLL